MLDQGSIRHLIEDADMIIIDFDSYTSGRLEMLKRIRQTAPNRKLPILILASSVKRKMIIELASIRDIEILSKPFEDIAFLQKVMKYKRAKIAYEPKAETTFNDLAYQNKLIEWNDAFKVGHEIIDREHKEIMENFAHLYKLMREGRGHEYYSDLLQFLEDYIKNHFEHEEHLLQEIEYDKIVGHKALHKQFTDKVKEIIDAHHSESVGDMELIRINLFIKKWLVHHILFEDRKIGVFMGLYDNDASLSLPEVLEEGINI
jgi:hemerythrin-like metal-binding protein